MKYTDDAINYLLTELSASDKEKQLLSSSVIINSQTIMLLNQSMKKMASISNNQTLEEQQKSVSRFPFFIWANYDIEEESNLAISANYLSTKVAKVAGLDLTKYQKASSHRCQVLPVVNAVGYVDTDGTCHYLKRKPLAKKKHGLIIMRFFSIIACLTNN